MSEPNRYTGKTEGSLLGSPHWEHPEGEWIKWEDYARLKAEVERLTAFTTRTIIPNEELQAEVERLTKAIIDSVEMRQRLREIEDGNHSK